MRRHLAHVSYLPAWKALLAAIACIGLTTACNLQDPNSGVVVDSGDPSDTSDGGGFSDVDDATDTQDSESPDIGDDTADDAAPNDASDGGADVCQEQSVADFCAANEAECGSFTGPGECTESRTASCGGCTGSDECVDNTCACQGIWSGDGIDAAFTLNETFYGINLGYLWTFDPGNSAWTGPELLSEADTPIPFANSPDVRGVHLWEGDGPTAAAHFGRHVLFINESLYWIFDLSEGRWVRTGDLADDRDDVFYGDSPLFLDPVFGDGHVTAAVAETDRDFYLIDGDRFHHLEVRDFSPPEYKLRTRRPEPLSDLFPDSEFGSSTARPWDNGMTWGTVSGRDDPVEFVVLGSENVSWISSDREPLVEMPVSPSSDLYGAASCIP